MFPSTESPKEMFIEMLQYQEDKNNEIVSAYKTAIKVQQLYKTSNARVDILRDMLYILFDVIKIYDIISNPILKVQYKKELSELWDTLEVKAKEELSLADNELSIREEI